MNMPIESVIWRNNAESAVLFFKRVCRVNPTGYRDGTGCLSSGFPASKKRGIKCTRAQFLRRLPWFSDYLRVTARLWISAQPIAPQQVRPLAQLGPCCWTAIRSKALLSVALLVQLPAKTGTFGSNRYLAAAPTSAATSVFSFISPLLNPLRVSVRGFFSCLHVSAHESPAHSENSRSIKGVAYV